MPRHGHDLFDKHRHYLWNGDATRWRVMEIIMQWQGPQRPSIRDICAALDLAPNSVMEQLCNLREDGLIQWEAGKSRTLTSKMRFIPVEQL